MTIFLDVSGTCEP